MAESIILITVYGSSLCILVAVISYININEAWILTIRCRKECSVWDSRQLTPESAIPVLAVCVIHTPKPTAM